MVGQSRWQWPLALILAPLTLWIAPGSAGAQTFSAPLVQCKAVTDPAAIAGCPATNDPLKGGIATINDMGDVTVGVLGAATNTTYTVTFVSGDGTTSSSLGSFKTDNKGDGAFRHDAYFKFGTVGAGNVVLSNGASEEFITGVAISSNGLESAADFQPGLVRCADVQVPASLSSCGSDPLSGGRVDVENQDGAFSITVWGAKPSQSYSAIFRSQSGTSTSLGTVGPTDRHGNARLIVTTGFAAGTIGSGSVVLQSGGTDEFLSGFKVNTKFVPPPVSVSSLVPCGSVTEPELSSCGGDPLDSGGYEVNATGGVTVKLTGAEPSTNYELWFRPLDNSGDVDTGLAIPTNSSGDDVAGPKAFFTSGTVGSGTFVVKRQGSGQPDEFVAGFEVH